MIKLPKFYLFTPLDFRTERGDSSDQCWLMLGFPGSKVAVSWNRIVTSR